MTRPERTAPSPTDADLDRRIQAAIAEKTSRRQIIGAVAAALIALGAGVGTALITGSMQSTESQVDFQRQQRIEAYEAFSAAQAAYAQDQSEAFDIVGGIHTPAATPSEEPRWEPSPVEQVNEIVEILHQRQVTLESTGFAVNMVATCQVRNATQRLLNAYAETLGGFRAARSAAQDGTLRQVQLHYFLPGSSEGGAAAAEHFQAAVRAELGIDPPMDDPDSWHDDRNPLNEGLEDC